MRSNIKFALILSFFALFIFSCQNEAVEETGQNQEETLVPNSPLANLMRSTASNDGTVDDILDNASCFSVELPVTIIANGITVTIESIENLMVLENLFDEYDDDEDDLEFLFPITIVLNDYEEIVIENQEQLEDFVEDCINNQEEVIECVDFIYPISFSIYNTDFQVIDNVVVNNDEELHDFIETLNEDSDEVLLASLDFPVSLVYADGSTTEVANNEELEAAINAAEDLCDDVITSCSNEEIAAHLEACAWVITQYAGDDNYLNYSFYFSEDGTLNVINGITAQSITGLWEMSTSDAGLPEIVISEMTGIQELEGSWIVVQCSEDEFVIEYQTSNGNEVQFVFSQNCEDELDCTAQEIALYLKECKWWSGTDVLPNNLNGPYFFNEDGTVIIGYNNGSQLEGTWNIAMDNMGIYLNLDVPQPYDPIALQWEIVDCDDDRLELVAGDHQMVLEQECWEEPECSQDDVANYLISCNIVPTINGYTSPLTTFQFNQDNTLFTMYQGDLPHNGTWDISSDNQGVFIIITFNGLEEYNGQWYIVECADNEMIFHQGDDELILACYEDPFECFENEVFELTECDQNGDGVANFNLVEDTIGSIECDVEVYESFYLTQADADTGANALPNPENYEGTDTETVYLRVDTTDGTYQVFPVYLNIVTEGCDDTCSEEDVDNIIQVCYWIPTSVAGDDNFNEFTFEFNDNQNFVVEGQGLSGVGVWMTYGNGEGNPTTVEISQLEGNLQMFNGTWTVVECSEAQMIFTLPNGSEMVLDRECE